MNKYLLIEVSILAVVLLVLASLSNVVGYQSFKSTTISDSPLFSVRTKRAINQGGKDVLTSNYLGKTNALNLPIPPQSNRTELYHNVINRIRAMDDSSFESFVRIAVVQLSKQEQLTDITPQQLITGLHQIRENPQAFMVYSNSGNGNRTWMATPTSCWFPGCYIAGILSGIFAAIFIIVFLLIFFLSGFHFTTSECR